MEILIAILLISVGAWFGFKKKPKEDKKPEPKPKPEKEELKLYDLNKVHNSVTDKGLYGEIINRCKKPFWDKPISTSAHETIHMLHAEQRNKEGGRIQCLYVVPDKLFKIREGQFTKDKVAEFIPKCFHSSRYNLYIKGSEAWNNRPLYIYDEWVAYIYGGFVANEHEDVMGNVTGVAYGALEFAIFSVALCMAAEKYDPDLLDNENQLKLFTKYNLEKTEDLFYKTRIIFPLESMEKTYDDLLYNQETESIRSYIRNNFDGVLLNEKRK